MKKMVMVCVTCVLSLHASAIQQAGSLLVDLSAADLVSSVGVGNKVQNWPNKGSLGLAFTNAVAGQGPELRTYGVANVPAVYFAGNANSILTGTPVDPAITGGNSWTLETWICIPATVTGGTTYFSWTYRGSHPATATTHIGPNYRLFEARYSTDHANAIEHHSDNVSWSSRIPAAEQWHHIVLTRDGATAAEYVYVDGELITTATKTSLNILPDGVFIIGGTQNSGRTGFEAFQTGYIGQIRVHTGFMPLQDAILNFADERGAYGAANNLAIWKSASTAPMPWEDPLNWYNGVQPTAGIRGLISNGGHAHLTTPAGTIQGLAVAEGELTLSGNAMLDMWVPTATMALYVANGNNATATVNVVEGTLGTRDVNTSGQLILGNSTNSCGTVNVGGGVLPARVEVARDTIVGNVIGATGRMNIKTNGTVTLFSTVNSYIYVGNNRSDGKLTMDGGTLSYYRLALVNNGGKGVLEFNDGEMYLTETLYLSTGTEVTSSQAIAYLNGGLLQTPRIRIDKKGGFNAIYFNGTTVRNTATQSDFIEDCPNLYIQTGGAVFDVVAATWPAITEITIQRALKHDPALGSTPDGGIIKRGPGLLRLSGANTFTGDIHLQDGLLFFSNNGALPGYTGKIRFDNPDAVVGANFTGGIAWLLPFIPNNAVGYLAVFAENASENIDLSNHPGLKLAFRGTLTYTGTITPPLGSTTLNLSPVHGATLTYSQAITGTTDLVVDGQGNGTLVLGTSNTYTGGTTVRGGKIRLDTLGQLGPSGTITLEKDGALHLNSNNFNPSAALMSRIATASRGYLLLNSNTAGTPFDLSAHPGIYLGTVDNDRTYTGTLTPNGNTYRAGGGWQTVRAGNNVSGISLQQNLADNGGTPRDLVIEGDGVVRVLNTSTFTGGVTVTNKGALHLSNTANQLAGSQSLYVNDGLLRLVGEVTVPAKVTVTAGPDGMEIDPSGYTHFAGQLKGNGRVWTATSTSAGGAFFADASTFTGVFDPCQANSTLGVGVGSTFGWNPSNVITNSGRSIGYFGLQYDGSLLWSSSIVRPLGSDSLFLGLKKRGSGTLTVDVAQDYNGDTLVEQGTLKVGHALALPKGYGKGNVGVSSGAVLDVNGRDITINGLINPGRVTDSLGTAQYLRAGLYDAGWTLAATIDPALTLVKIGTGTMTMSDLAVNVTDMNVEAGTVAINMPVGISGDVSLAGTSTLQFSGTTPPRLESDTDGTLTAYYYRVAGSISLISALNALNTFFYANTPTLLTDTAAAGATLDFGRTTTSNCRFASPYDEAATDSFVLICRGTFIAEETGTYSFGLQCDDGSSIFIDGVNVLNTTTWNTPATSGTIHLTEGEHDIIVGYYENTGNQGLAVWMKAPSDAALSLLPQSLLKSSFDLLSSRVGKLDGVATSKLVLNGNATVDIGPAAQSDTATFSGTVTATATSTLRKAGLGRQVFTAASLSLGYIDPLEGILEIATPGNATSFIISYMTSSNPDTGYTGATLSGLTGGAPGGVLQLNSEGLLKMNRATGASAVDTEFAGSIAGPANTAIVKNDEQVLTLTGDNGTFHGAWLIHKGVVNLVDGATLGDGIIVVNGELRFTRDEDYSVALSGGKGNIVKRGDGTLYVSCASGSTLGQSFVAEGGKIVFDTQGGTLFLGGTLEMAGGTFAVTGGGRVVLPGGELLPGLTVDGTEWLVQTSSASPIQDGLVVALDAANLATLTIDANNVVSQWRSMSDNALIYTNDNAALRPFYDASAFSGKGAVVFGTNFLDNTSVATRLMSSGTAKLQTIVFATRLTGAQAQYSGIFGQSNADKGIRFENTGTGTRLRLPGSADDFWYNTGKVFLNGVDVTSETNPEVGTVPFVTAHFVGNQTVWNNAINTTLGNYHYSQATARNYRGELGELLAYNRTLAGDEREMVENYLMDKWMYGKVIEGGLPEGMTVELSNDGTLNLNGSAQTIASVVRGEGGGSVVNGTLTVTDTLVITVRKDGTVDPLAFDKVIFGPNAKLVVLGIENAKGAIDVFTANSASPVPPFAKENLPKGWTCSYHNGLCRISFGATIIILK